jgi:hypothetical protein
MAPPSTSHHWILRIVEVSIALNIGTWAVQGGQEAGIVTAEASLVGGTAAYTLSTNAR